MLLAAPRRMHHDTFLSRRAFLTLGGALAAWRLVPGATRPADSGIVIGVLVPPPPGGTPNNPLPTAMAHALDGIRMGAAEAGRAATLLGRTLVVRERTGTALADAQALVAEGARVLLAGLVTGSVASLGRTPTGPGAPVINVLDDGGPRPTCSPDWLFHVAPGFERRFAASAAGDSLEGRGDDATARAWDPSLEKFGAEQLNARFRAFAGREMDEAA